VQLLTIGSGVGLYVIGLGDDGFVNVVGWRDLSGNWQPSYQISSGTRYGHLFGQFNLFGLGADDQLPYLAATSEPSGQWGPGIKLPAPALRFGEVVEVPAIASDYLIGLGLDGKPYLTSYIPDTSVARQSGAGISF
jgi:hypothetical protein